MVNRHGRVGIKGMSYSSFWKNKKVFLTGHTGFKGSWLCIWLHSLGAKVTGYALDPPSQPSLYEIAGINRIVESIYGDVRDYETLHSALQKSNAEIVLHMAAQSLVRESYLHPVETYEVNVMGTVHVLEAVRACRNVRALLNVTTDKAYENQEWVWGYRENDKLGGSDVYSSSKACSELATASYRKSFFSSFEQDHHKAAIATVRAGNVIGGGDWAKDRLIPDCIRALLENKPIHIRNPQAIRPWQHVLEPLNGYLILARRLYEEGYKYADAWNFGPDNDNARTVEWVVKQLCEKWGEKAYHAIDKGPHLHEASFLKLDCSKAKSILLWRPRWDLETALDKIVTWTKAYCKGANMLKVCEKQILDYPSN
jgi:CDP-glucose 4,6-dehydratase